MKFSVDKQERYAILEIQAENLNSIVAPELKSEIIFLFNEGVQNLILDISSVKYVDSSGLSAILTADRLWKEQGTFVLTGATAPNVARLIDISRLETVVAVRPSTEASVEYIMLQELQRELESDDPASEEE